MSGFGDRLRREARRWFVLAREDVRAVDACLGSAEPVLGPAAYHLQQAAEKAIKGLLVTENVAVGRTHDLVRLGDLASSHYPAWIGHFERLAPISIWNSAYRYPDAAGMTDGPPDIEELFAALTEVQDFLKKIEEAFGDLAEWSGLARGGRD